MPTCKSEIIWVEQAQKTTIVMIFRETESTVLNKTWNWPSGSPRTYLWLTSPYGYIPWRCTLPLPAVALEGIPLMVGDLVLVLVCLHVIGYITSPSAVNNWIPISTVFVYYMRSEGKRFWFDDSLCIPFHGWRHPDLQARDINKQQQNYLKTL